MGFAVSTGHLGGVTPMRRRRPRAAQQCFLAWGILILSVWGRVLGVWTLKHSCSDFKAQPRPRTLSQAGALRPQRSEALPKVAQLRVEGQDGAQVCVMASLGPEPPVLRGSETCQGGLPAAGRETSRRDAKMLVPFPAPPC